MPAGPSASRLQAANESELDRAVVRLLEAEAQADTAIAECAAAAQRDIRSAEEEAQRIQAGTEDRLRRLRARLAARADAQIATLHAERARLRAVTQLDTTALEQLSDALERTVAELTGG